MAVGEAVRMWSRHDGEVTTENGITGQAVIREMYQVTSAATDTLASVLDATNLPLMNDIYPGTDQVRVKRRAPRQVGPTFWHVEIVYEGPIFPAFEKGPLDVPPIIKWGKVESDEPVDQDRNGNPIVTANGEPIEGVTKKISDITVSITRNYASIDLAATHQYLHSVNSDTFLGFSAGTGRMTQFSATEKFEDAIGGWFEVNAVIQFRFPYNTTPARAWWARVLHEGYYIKDASGMIKRAQDDDGKDRTKPVLLKSDGTIETNSANAHWLEFEIYQPLSYQSLGLV